VAVAGAAFAEQPGMGPPVEARGHMRAKADRTMTIHRIIEAHAATQGDVQAIADCRITLSYRELNQRANAMARHLLASGFRRGGVATVCLPPSAETAVVLLAVLKAGGTYVLMTPGAHTPWPTGVSFADKIDDDDVRYRVVDTAPAFECARQSAANLPIVTRSSDVACVIADGSGEPLMLVPHATIMSLKRDAAPRVVEWAGEPGALDLWAALISGATVTLNDAALRSAA
jgi:arthrofactin-type cyclic lipopeptide synthetase B